jgi:PTS system nitrogen regulatory IIA component
MDLKIKDVAELLHVSEITIRRWLANGQIPAYKLNHQYRFSRLEIENWMMSCKLKQEKGFSAFGEKEDEDVSSHKAGLQQFSLFRAVNQGDVLVDVEGGTKEEVIQSCAKGISSDLGLDADLVAELLVDRERLMSTALNHGIAVPHPREFILKDQKDRVVIVFPKNPIDFGALDGQPVHTLFFLFSSEDKRHLHLLAKIAHLASSLEALEFLRSKPSKEDVLHYIKLWESKIGDAKTKS